MKSRRYAIFTNGYTTLFDAEVIIGPADIKLVINGFFNFFLRYFTNRGENFCVFAAPTTFGELYYGPVEIEFWATGDQLPKFNEERVLKRIMPELGDDPMEFIDSVKFKRIYK